jgi:hypothetical protein
LRRFADVKELASAVIVFSRIEILEMNSAEEEEIKN